MVWRYIFKFIAPLIFLASFTWIIGSSIFNIEFNKLIEIMTFLSSLNAIDYIIILIAFFSIVAIYMYHSYKNTPINIAFSKAEIFFEDANKLHHYTIKRDQFIKALQPNITAYYTELMPSPQGSVQCYRQDYHAHVNNEDITSDVILSKEGECDRKLSIIHEFKKNLPWNPLNYIAWPGRTAEGEPQFFKRTFVHRRDASCFKEPEDDPDYKFELIVNHYKINNIILDINFPNELSVNKDRIKAVIIKNGAVKKLELRPNGNPNGFRLSETNLERCRISVDWGALA